MVSFNSIFTDNYDALIGMLSSNLIDAFITNSVADPSFEAYDYLLSQEFFSLVYTPILLTTANPEYEKNNKHC